MKFKVLIVLHVIVQLTIDQQNLAFNDKATNNVCVYISHCSTYRIQKNIKYLPK